MTTIEKIELYIGIFIFLVLGCGFLCICYASDLQRKQKTMDELPPAISHYHEHLFAELVTTNLVSVPCNCGHCRPSEGIVIPEHIGVVGYDLKVVVSTQYLPIVRR